MTRTNMRKNLSRRALLLSSGMPTLLLAQTQTPPGGKPAAATPPLPIGESLVKNWVSKAHQRRLEPMRDLLRQEPNLIHASWDWGAGDYESALQAAAHTGSQEMARFLLDQGARLDLFAAAMLGELTFVRTSVEVFPRALTVRGAHGIPLLSHAVAGDAPAGPVVEYLLAKGADVNAVHDNGMTALGLAVQTGRRETVRLLLAKGANPNVRAASGATPLSLSVKGNKAEIASDLKAAGATE